MLKLEFRIPPLALDMKVDTEALLDEAAASLLQSTLTRFMAELSPTGEPWVPSKAALKRKLNGIPGGTLFHTGDLFRSMKVVRGEENTRSLGTSIPYAEKHQLGLEGMVKREFLGVSQSDFVALQDIINARMKDFIS